MKEYLVSAQYDIYKVILRNNAESRWKRKKKSGNVNSEKGSKEGENKSAKKQPKRKKRSWKKNHMERGDMNNSRKT
ncbi:hypothetical protein RND71_019690 [Anisodus tanguticus]|uniref:Uncharacterized protein n=1 Tax=Anisodus tanguticus TaxID=243964 RepID=A0AAE1S101_9SOLA|nr:hypothetical protein RND71_019690 [Anisodus tanguticus]